LRITIITNPSDKPVTVSLTSQTGNSFRYTIKPKEAILSFGFVRVFNSSLYVKGFFNGEGKLLYAGSGEPLLVQYGYKEKSFFFSMGIGAYSIQYGISTGYPEMRFPATLVMPEQTKNHISGFLQKPFKRRSVRIQGATCLLKPLFLQASCQGPLTINTKLRSHLITSKSTFLYKLQGYYNYRFQTNISLSSAIYHGVPVNASILTTLQSQIQFKSCVFRTKLTYRYFNSALSFYDIRSLGLWFNYVHRLDNKLVSDIVGRKQLYKLLLGQIFQIDRRNHYIHAHITHLNYRDYHLHTYITRSYHKYLNLYSDLLNTYNQQGTISALVIPSTGWWSYEDFVGGYVLRDPQISIYGHIYKTKYSQGNLNAFISETV